LEIDLVSEDGTQTGMVEMIMVINLPNHKIRKYIHARLSKASVSKVIIERTLKLVTVTITTARPGIIIGKGGQEVDKLKKNLRKLLTKRFKSTSLKLKDLNLTRI
jgi:ribosomal protein S3